MVPPRPMISPTQNHAKTSAAKRPPTAASPADISPRLAHFPFTTSSSFSACWRRAGSLGGRDEERRIRQNQIIQPGSPGRGLEEAVERFDVALQQELLEVAVELADVVVCFDGGRS